ncbi:lipase family protein [Planosporangium thailandense]|uniref:Lipase family protein n=1 Tax=Planosporangium thailandense TaxID=765197 RepID=A0ABX0YAL0_9ACTN|nr:lipase family protein [Planosporangium thailandense]
MVSPVTGLPAVDGAGRAGMVAAQPGARYEEAYGPSYRDLITLKTTSPGFPVYPDLTQVLTTTTKHPNDVVAHTMAVCSGYAYADQRIVATMMTRLGLENNHCTMLSCTVDGMFISATAFLVQSSDGRVVILCYRGTQPLNFISWLGSGDVDPEEVTLSVAGSTGSFRVHGGFYRNERITGDDVIAGLWRAVRGRSVHKSAEEMPHPLEALYITGHSLGGAMAALRTVRLLSDHAFEPITEKLKAVYTFGQPMLGCPDFAKACEGEKFLASNVIRYRYRNDVVPSFPPTMSGEFAHFGQEYRYSDSSWRHSPQPTTQLSNLTELAAAPLALLSGPIKLLRKVPFPASWEDHNPQHYVSKLKPPHVGSEFSD